MTYSNEMFNPHPCANPFNTRLGPSNYSLNPFNPVSQMNVFNSKSKQLPDPKPAQIVDSKSLKPPDTAPPMSIGQMLMAIDQHYSDNCTWRDSEIMQFQPSSKGMPGEQTAYQKHAEAESKKMEASMTPEQKKMLDDAMKMFPESKFEDAEEGEE